MFQYTRAAQLCLTLIQNGDGAEVALKKSCALLGISFSNRNLIRKTEFYKNNCAPLLEKRKTVARAFVTKRDIHYAL